MGDTPTVYDVAARVGVSTATISRFFRNPAVVKPATRELIERAVDELGYTPSGLARGLAEKHTGVIGLYSFSGHEPDELETIDAASADLVRTVREEDSSPRLYPLFADEVLRGVELECTLRGIPLALGWQQADASGVAIDEVARRVDGLIVLPHVMSDQALRRLGRTKPIVMVSHEPAPSTGFSSVTVNNRAGMAALTAHLVETHGVEEFWFAGPADDYDRSNRYAGFREALTARGIPAPEPLALGAGGRMETKKLFAPLVAAGPLPGAIVCSSDQTALGLLEALAAAGVSVPGDVIVTGFDGIDAGRSVRPSLTTVRQPMDALGRIAVELLADRIADPDTAPESRMLPVELVLRRSCGC
ncbi:LacI family DNA-binding transcriptional regulator [Leifsonia sp. NPDC080035]|uniref:LacI family DNA-binding transcriptional regulator n=1 Tax=Leifsonia sp. NPDC080035 TaxID=3143936 RepID=A0AAU7G539_9MICO